MRWFVSDTNFGSLRCDLPFSTYEEMDQEIVHRWNRVVGYHDMVFHLGDVSCHDMNRTKKIVGYLNGYHTLILGDRDYSVKCMHKIGFASVVNSAFIKISNIPVQLIHNPDEAVNTTIDQAQYIIHGHQCKSKGNFINVSVDAWNYAPVSERSLTKLIKSIKNNVS